jgi:hypothetical protein
MNRNRYTERKKITKRKGNEKKQIHRENEKKQIHREKENNLKERE